MNYFAIILTLLFSTSWLKANHKENMVRIVRDKCYKETCPRIKQELAANCINKCASEKCYGEVYGKNPLEYGETDNARERNFVDCVFTERKNKKEW